MIKPRKCIIPLIFASVLSACEDQGSQTNPNNPPTSSVDNYAALRGIYVWGEGVETFTPCGQDKEYWVFTYTDEMWERLKLEHQNLSAKPYGGLYIEINGVLGPKLHPIVGGEYAADFDGHVVIESIEEIRRTSEGDCKS